MLYTVDQDHPLSSSYTKALTSEEFEQYVAIAEAVLGIVEPVLTDESSVARLRLAIIIQVNFQTQFGLDPYVKSSEGMSSQASSSVVWRDRYIDPRALAIVLRVSPPSTKGWIGAGTGSQSFRTNDYGNGFLAYRPGIERFR